MVELYKQVLGSVRSSEWLDWKYYKNPAGDHDIQVAEVDGEVVGSLGIRAMRAKIEEQEISACHVCDLMIKNDFRRGTFMRLSKAATRDYEGKGRLFVYGTSVKDTLLLSVKLLGFATAGPIKRLVRILDPTPYLQRKLKFRPLARILGLLGAFYLELRHWRSMKTAPDYLIKKVDRVDERFDELWQRRRDDYEISIVRDTTYLRWRYFQNPVQTYTVLAAEKEGRLEGFIVVCLRVGFINRGFIVDMLADPSDDELCRSLLSEALRFLGRLGVNNVSCWWLEHMPAFDICRQMGFVVQETNHDLIVRTHNDRWDNDFLSERRRWYFCFGDTDHV